MKKLLTKGIFGGLFVIAFFSGVRAQETEGKTEKVKPIVAVIKADWRPYCKNVEPVMTGLMKDYSEKMNFVGFDVTNDETTKGAMKKAEELGLSKFFSRNISKRHQR